MSSFTIKELAELLGLSITTVSQILNNKGQLYKPQTCRRVLRAAREMGYRPNAAARAVSKGKFNCLGVLSSTVSQRGYLFPSLMKGIQLGCEESDYYLTVTRFPDEKLLNSRTMPKVLREWMVDGFLVLYWEKQIEKLEHLVRETGIPSIWLNCKRENDCVYPDEYGAGRMVAEHLLGLGHRRIAFVNCRQASGPDVHFSGPDRYAGYEAAMKEAGLQPRLITRDDYIPRNERIAFAESWLGRPDRPTAVITYTFSDALPILYGAVGKLRLDVPRDLSIITFNDRLLDDCGMAITTAVTPLHETGFQAARRLREKIETGKGIQPQCVLRYGLLQGETCAVAPN